MNTNKKVENTKEMQPKKDIFSPKYFVRNIKLETPKYLNIKTKDIAVCASTLYAGITGASAENHDIFLYAPTLLSAPFAVVMFKLKKLNSNIMYHSIKKHYKEGNYPVPCMDENGKFVTVPNSKLNEAVEHAANIYAASLLTDFRIQKDAEINYKKEAVDGVARASLESVICYSLGASIRNLF